MPKHIEEELKKQYGKHSSIPYKIMNKLGFMKGNKHSDPNSQETKRHKLALKMKQGRGGSYLGQK